jgi:exosortase/archaeosortase family protein
MKYYRNLGLRLVIIMIFIVFYEFYAKILSPLTIYPAYFIIDLFYSANLINGSIFIENYIIKFIPACIAVLAYALLFLLIILTKNIDFKKSLKIFLFGSLLILIMNIIRIDLLLFILVEFGDNMFDKVHLLFWNFVSGIYVAFVWIYLVKRFKIQEIPIVSDIKELYNRINS